MLLDNPCWRWVGYWEAWTSKMEKPTEKEVPLFVIAIFPTGITYDETESAN